MKTNPSIRQKSLDLEQQRKVEEFREKAHRTSDGSSLRNVSWDTLVYTGIICYVQMAFGTCVSSVGPALVDLKFILKTSMSEITMITLFLTIGYLLGLLFGFLYKYINRQITLIVSVLLFSTFTILIPYSETVWHLYLAIFIHGLGFGIWTNGKTVWLIEMWRQRSTPVLQLSAFMYGIGTFVGPLVAKPYLTGENKIYVSALEDVNHSSYLLANNSYGLLSTNASDIFDKHLDRSSKLKISFLISSSLQVISLIAMTMMFFVKRYHTTEVQTNELRGGKLLDNGKALKTLILLLITAFAAFICVSEEIYLQFSATYFQYIPLRLTASESAEIVSVMALLYTVGRGMNFFVAIKIKPQFMIAFHTIIIFVAMFILYLGSNSITVLWIGSLLMSFGFAPVYPLIFGLAGLYLDVTNKIGTMIMLSTDSLNIFLPFIFGNFIEKRPNVFIWSILACVFTSSLIFLCIVYSVFRAKKAIENREGKGKIMQDKF